MKEMRISSENIQQIKNLSSSLTQNIATILATCIFGIETESILQPSVAFPGCYTFKNLDFSEKNTCPFHFAANDIVKVTRDTKEKEDEIKANQLQRWIEELQIGNVSDKTLLEWGANRIDNSAIISARRPDGACNHFLGALKGNPTYNNQLAAKIRTDAEELDKRYRFKYFVTFTHAADIQKGNRVNEWQAFSKNVQHSCRRLSYKLNGAYMCVLESTFNGFPHAHCVFYTNKLLDPQHELYKKTTTIRMGATFEYIKKYATAPVFDVQVAADSNTVHYLVKYISKSSYGSMKKMPDKKDKKKYKSWRKDMLTNFCTTVLKVRAYRRSQYKDTPLLPNVAAQLRNQPLVASSSLKQSVSIRFDGKYTPDWNVLMTVVDNQKDVQKQARCWRSFLEHLAEPSAHGLRAAALDWLLNNLPNKCACQMRVGGGGHCHEVLGKYLDGKARTEEQVWADTLAVTQPVGCQDCLIKRLYARRAGQNVSLSVDKNEQTAEKVLKHTPINPYEGTEDQARLAKSRQAKDIMREKFASVCKEGIFKARFEGVKNWTFKNEKEASEVFAVLEEQFTAKKLKEQCIKEAAMGTPETPPLRKEEEQGGYIVRVILPKLNEKEQFERHAWVALRSVDRSVIASEWEAVESFYDATIFNTEEGAMKFCKRAASLYPAFNSFEVRMEKRHDIVVGGVSCGF